MSDAAADDADEVAARRPGIPFLVRGLFQGAAAGAFAGLLDAARAIGSPNDLLEPGDAVAVVLFYAAWFAPLGVLAAAAARWFDWPQRMLSLLLAGGAVLFFFGAWLNVAALPGFTAPLSLFVDGLLIAATAALVAVRYRAPGDDAPHGRRWLILGIASLVIAFVLGLVFERRADGPAPQARAVSRGDSFGGKKRPNVLVVLVDALRADRLRCYGYGKPTSPEFDSFAADATLFQDCRAVTSWTKPSVASLFTSMYPSVHACREQREVLVSEAETLAEVFRAAGWRTAAFADNPFISPEFGFAQGFDTFDGLEPSVVVNGTLLGKALFMTRVMSLVGRPFGVGDREERGSASLHERFLKFADAERDASSPPWFAYVHAMEPHLPYLPRRADAEEMGFPAGGSYAEPPRYNGILPFQTTPKPEADLLLRLNAQYDGEIRGWSREFGVLHAALRERNLIENTIVVVLADHGEEFCEHGGWTHGHSLHREVTQVPFVIRLPDALGDAAKASRGRKVGGVATLLDVGPTLLELCGIDYPALAEPGRSGRSLRRQLLPAADGKSPSESVGERPILAEVTMSPVGIRSIREASRMFIRAEQPLDTARALYDDLGDPRHRTDRIDDDRTRAAELESTMDDLFRRLAAYALAGRTGTIDPGTAELLQKLGYLGGK